MSGDRGRPSIFGIAVLVVFSACFVIFGLSLNHNVQDPHYVAGNDNATHMATGALVLGRIKTLADGLERHNIGFGLRPPLYSVFLSAQSEEIATLPRDLDKLKPKTNWQLGIYLLAVLSVAFSCSIVYGRAWLGCIVILAASMDLALLAISLTLRSHSLAASMFIFSLAFLPVALSGKTEWRRSLGSLMFGIFIALTAMTRLQYQYTLIPILPLLYFAFRHETPKRRWLNLVLALVPLVLMSLSWYSFARNLGTVSRHEKGFIVFLGKSVAPYYYVGDENSPAQNAIAELWNGQMRTGAKPSAFPVTAYVFYRDNYATIGLSEDELEADFSKQVQELALRSLWFNLGDIVYDRWMSFMGYVGFVGRASHRELPRHLYPLLKSDLEKLYETSDELAPVITRFQFELSKEYFPWFYQIEVGICVFGILLLFYALLSRWISVHWMVVAFPALYVMVDLTMVGLGFNGPKRLYKIMDILPIWMSCFLMMGCLVEVMMRALCEKVSQLFLSVRTA